MTNKYLIVGLIFFLLLDLLLITYVIKTKHGLLSQKTCKYLFTNLGKCPPRPLCRYESGFSPSAGMYIPSTSESCDGQY